MKQTNAPKLTPSPSSKEPTRAVVDKGSASSAFMSMALDMTWRLALAFLIPLILGIELDKHYKTHHLYLIIGLVLAVAGAFLVVYRSYKLANELTAKQFKEKKRAQ